MERVLQDIVLVMETSFGMKIAGYDTGFLRQSLDKRCLASGVQSLTDYLDYLSKSEAEAKLLYASMNITYTEFFRNSLTFAHIEQVVLPDLLRKKSKTGELRVWSAGCSSGQEAYSLAMCIENHLARSPQPLRYRIIATDVTEEVLAVARRGVYEKESLSNVKLKDLEQYFIRTGEKYAIVDQLKKNMSFSQYDLLDSQFSYPPESIFGHFDVVMCSNLLFYYLPEQQKTMVQRVINALAPGGYFITGETEKHAVAQITGLRSLVPTSPIFKKMNGGSDKHEKPVSF